MKRLFFLFLLIVGSAVAAAAQRGALVMSYVPEGAVAVVRVDWKRVRNDAGLKRIIGGDDFGGVAAQMGLMESQVTEWAIFSEINPTSSRGLGIIVTGNFTVKRVLQFARSKGWASETIGELSAYINPADGSYLLPLRNGLVAGGTRSGVEMVRRLISKRSDPLITRQPFSAMWRQLGAGGAPISLLLGIPEQYQGVADIAYKVSAKLMNLASFRVLGTVMEAMGLVRSIGMNVWHNTSGYPTQLLAMMNSETKAWIAAGALNLLRKAPSAIGVVPRTPADREAFAGLQSMTATYKGEVLSVELTMPASVMPGQK